MPFQLLRLTLENIFLEGNLEYEAGERAAEAARGAAEAIAVDFEEEAEALGDAYEEVLGGGKVHAVFVFVFVFVVLVAAAGGAVLVVVVFLVVVAAALVVVVWVVVVRVVVVVVLVVVLVLLLLLVVVLVVMA